MFLYIFLLCALAWPPTRCEPPVNRYLPPSSSAGGRPPPQYGPPKTGGGGASGGTSPRGSIGEPNQLQDNYLPPGHSGHSTVDTQYGSPSSGGFGQGSGRRGSGSPSQGYKQGHENNAPDSQHGTPGQDGGPSARLTESQLSFRGDNRDHTQSNGGGGFGSPRPGSSQRPENSYGPPPTGFQSPDSRSSGQSNNRRPGTQGSFDSSLNGGSQGRFEERQPSASYGVPGFDGTGGGKGNNGPGSNFDGGNSDEPAKYEFSYDVDDSQTGTKFGHSEQRDGDLATGEYYVVLPDGRKQVVEYEADLEGYKPQIRYEDGIAGTQGGSQGYSQGGPKGSDNSNGVFGQGTQSGTAGRYQNGNAFAKAESLSNQRDTGYPNGIPRNGGSEQGSGQGKPSGSSNNFGNLNGGSQGYPSSGPQGNNGGFSNGGPQGGEGYPSGGPRGNGRGSQSSGRAGNGGEDGYPRGGPSGARGTGY